MMRKSNTRLNTHKQRTEGEMRRRIIIVLLFFLAAFTALGARLFVLQITGHAQYVALAAKQHRLDQNAPPERGSIFMQDKRGALIPLALNQRYRTLVANPQQIEDVAGAAALIAEEFNVPIDEVREKLSQRKDRYVVLAKKIDGAAAARFVARAIPGISFEQNPSRVYPYGSLAAHIVGFVNKEAAGRVAGRYGVEQFYDEELSSARDATARAPDALSIFSFLGKKIIRPENRGQNVVLTIDYNIQTKSEQVLRAIKEKWNATSGNVLVLEPATGKIRALAANPSFDLNEFYKEKSFGVFLNPLVESTYELGSVLKPITMAGGLEAGVVQPETVYQDSGELKIDGYTIRNFDKKAHDRQTMTQVLEKSLNTGAVFVEERLGKERFYQTLKDFGFGQKTEVDLPGEVKGNMSNLVAGSDVDFATASFGQGIAVSDMQLATAISAIANGGQLVRPSVVEKIMDNADNETLEPPQAARQVIRKETADTLTKMLISAVRNGFENQASVKGYFVAGKTGTAQIPRSDGRSGYSDAVIHTFVGYAPAFHPRFLVLLQLNAPQGNRFAANTLTPAFHDLAEFILNYYEIPPDEK